MSVNKKSYESRQLMSVIGDEDTVTGMLLAGIGQVNEDEDKKRNFFVVDAKTSTDKIEQMFQEFTSERKDIAILLINQHVSIECD